MSANTLEAALAGHGIRCRVEERDRVAILRLADGAAAPGAREWRAEVVRLAREHGFTHVALELPAP